MLTTAALSRWATQAQAQAAQGQVNQRILALASCDPHLWAVQVDLDGCDRFLGGDMHHSFSLMSVIKPFLLLYLLEQYGMEAVFEWVGTVPSDQPFNSLAQLQADGGFPRNPMINSGAIALSSHLPGSTGCDRADILRQWLNQQAGCQLAVDDHLLASVHTAGREPNQALVECLVQSGQIQSAEITLDAYERICCLSGSVQDLALLGRLLACESTTVQTAHRCAVNALMLTCGLYEASSTYAVQIGLPMKSGISGALVAIVPHQGAIAAYSPALDNQGNSIAALAFVRLVKQHLALSIFG